LAGFAWSATAKPKSLPGASVPSKPAARSVTLDKDTVKDLYLAGDFDKLVALLENMRQERRMRDRDDSVFIYKYLGVVYGVDTATRRKAEAFLYQMLKLDPKQDLIDLEVGDNIKTMFREVRKRYERVNDEELPPREVHSTAQEKTKPAAQDKPSPGRLADQAKTGTGTPGEKAEAAAKADSERKWMWVAGGAAAVTVVGIGAILLLSDPGTKTTTLVTEVK